MEVLKKCHWYHWEGNRTMDGVAGEAGGNERGPGSRSAECLEKTIPRRDSPATRGCL